MPRKPSQSDLSNEALELKRKNERNHNPAGGAVAVLRRRQVLERLGISNSTLYTWVARGIIPPPLDAGPGTQVRLWLERDIDGVILRLARERDDRLAEAE